jgi:hypothetical protein
VAGAERLDDRARVRAAAHGLGQRRREALQHRGVEQEVLDLLGLAGEHLLGQVVEVGVARPRRGSEEQPAGLSREEETRNPALGVPMQVVGAMRHRQPQRPQELGALLLGQGERLLADLHHPGRAQAPQWERQRGPARKREMGARRQVADEKRERMRRRASGQRVHIVQRDHEVLRDRVDDLVGEFGDLLLDRSIQAESRSDAGEHLGQPGREVG